MRNQLSSSAGMGAAPVRATSNWSSPTNPRIVEKATASRNSYVSISSGVAVPQVIFSAIGAAASTASATAFSFSGSAARAA